jgi:hypothetical protein
MKRGIAGIGVANRPAEPLQLQGLQLISGRLFDRIEELGHVTDSHQIWIACSRTASAASLNASEWVGCAWQV